jgi:hypothetical protein
VRAQPAYSLDHFPHHDFALCLVHVLVLTGVQLVENVTHATEPVVVPIPPAVSIACGSEHSCAGQFCFLTHRDILFRMLANPHTACGVFAQWAFNVTHRWLCSVLQPA